MATKDLTLPDIGEGVTEGEMVAWLVKEGDSVEADQPVAEVMTDKATVEVPAPESGVVKKLISKEGDVIPVGDTMMVLELGASSGATTAAPEAPSAPVAEPSASTTPSANLSAPAASTIQPPVGDSSVLA